MQLTCCKHSLRIEPIRPASRHAFCYSFSMETLPSVCPLDCPDRCALDVTVEGGRLVKIDGSDRSEYTDGYICAKVRRDRKSTRLNSSHRCISYAVFCLKKKKKQNRI